MINNLVLVGRVATIPEVKTFEDGTRVADFYLAVDRPFKTADGNVETDFFKISAWQSYADVVYKYCGVGSIIGVKGRLMSRKIEVGDKKYSTVDVIAERVAFIKNVHPSDEVVEEDAPVIGEAELVEKTESKSAKKK